MSKLKEDFSEIFDFFNMDENERIEKFEKVLTKIASFADKVQDKIQNGSKEENEELQKTLKEIQEKVEEEKVKLFQKIGISEDDLKTFLMDKNNFSQEEWQSMQEIKDYLKINMGEKPENKEKVKVKKSKTQWIQS
jgi:hypothetical protein